MGFFVDNVLCSLSRRTGKFPGAERIANAIVPQQVFRPGRIETLRLDGMQFRVCPRSRVGWNLFVFGSYDPQLRSIMQRFIKPGATMIDAGANIGWHTLHAAKLVGNAGNVHAFEPNPNVRTELFANIKSNRFDNVRVWELALSDINGKATFNAPEVSSLDAGDGSLRIPVVESELSTQIEVTTIRLDSMELNLTRLDFIKIDVEGHEAAVFIGAMETIGKFRPAIAFEHISGNQTDATKITALLSELGYTFYGYNDRQQPHSIADLRVYNGDVIATPERISW